MKSHSVIAATLIAAIWIATISAGAQQVTKQDVPGITNFARVETTVACAGATGPEAVPEVKKMGFASIINLREASEPGADVEAEEAAAKAAAIRSNPIPF